MRANEEWIGRCLILGYFAIGEGDGLYSARAMVDYTRQAGPTHMPKSKMNSDLPVSSVYS